jgi:hypothetical protein
MTGYVFTALHHANVCQFLPRAFRPRQLVVRDQARRLSGVAFIDGHSRLISRNG